MSYNTRRGGGNFNKGVLSSQVGQRRPTGSNNYRQGPFSQGFIRDQRNENYANISRLQDYRQHHGRQSTSQQQMARQQQMLVQKKQQLSQQQQQQAQQKQTITQQMQQKQQEELEQKIKKEQEEKQQKELEQKIKKEQEELEQKMKKEQEEKQQKELELQKKELELQMQKEKEIKLQLLKDMELKKAQDLELQKAKEAELQKLKEIEMQQKEEELQKQKELELERIKQEQLMLIKKEDAEKLTQQTKTDAQMSQEENLVEMVEDANVQVPEPPIISEGGVEKNLFKRRPPQKNRKLSKYEIQRRRNIRLSKLLQPKSAMVILNEVGKNVTYNVERSQTRTGPKGYMFKATVVVDDATHEGYGLSKASAKNDAAEKALRCLVKNRKLIQTSTSEAQCSVEGEEPMDTSEKPSDIPLAWQQFASFAIYKLLDTWGEDLEVIKEDVKVDKKPSKKMPPNPELINPLMLMNQMLPRTNFIELPRTTNGLLSTFNFQAVVDGKTFNGSGISKKVAKRSVAYAICSEVLGIQYPPEIYTPPSNAVETC